MIVEFQLAHPAAQLPEYATPEAAGADVRSVNALTLYPGDRALVQTGLNCMVPKGYELQVRPRSGLAFKKGVTVLNSPGTIDSDYRGPLGVLLINHGDEPFEIALGDRIAQIVVAPVEQARFMSINLLTETNRGAGGFGSTGVA